MKLAYPIALAVARADHQQGYLRCEHLVRAFDRALRLLAAATCARYLEHVRGGGERFADVDALMAALVRPSLGQWLTVARDATEALGKRGLVSPAFRKLVRTEAPRLAKIVELRNAREHAEDESGDAELERLVTSFLETVEQLPELQLTAIDEAGTAMALEGADAPSFVAPGPVRIVNDALDLSPFVVGEQAVAAGPVEVFLYHGRHRKKGTLVHMAASRGGTGSLESPELARRFDLLVRPGADPYRAIATRVTASPFRKLRAYSYLDADVFRGREQSIRDVADLIDESALVVLHAPSGTGKTSLLRAGVRPAVDDAFTWVEVEARGDVVEVASAAISRELEVRGQTPAGALADRIRALADMTGRSVLLVVDALEEMFRGAEADIERRVEALVETLRSVLETPDRCHVLLSMRADYLNQLERLREAGLEQIFAVTIALRPLDSAGARAALIEPLAACGLHVSGKLAETIVRDLGGEGQAVSAVELAIVGDALFERANELGMLATASPERPTALDASVYASLGGAGQVLAAYVRGALAAFIGTERDDVQQVLTSMLGGGGVRIAPMELAAIVERTRLDEPVVHRLLAALVEARVVQTTSTGAAPTFRIAHDLVALELFAQLGEAERRALEVRDALEAAARAWHAGGRPRSGFPSAKQLAYYEQARGASRIAEEFLGAAQRAARRRRRIERAALVLVALLMVAASVTAVLAWRANGAQRVALRDALASQALALAPVPDRREDAVASALRAIALDGRPLSALGGPLTSALSSAASAASDGTRFVDLADQPFAPRVGRFAPVGDLVALGDVGGTVSLFEARTGKQVAVLGRHAGGSVSAVAFSPDGKTLASAGADREVAIWDVQARTRRATLRGHARDVVALAFSADGARLATASVDGTARLWDVATAREQGAVRGHGAMVFSVEASPDGSRILVSSDDGVARLLDRATGKTLLELRGHTDSIPRAHFARDGRIVTASMDRTVRIWDGTNGTLLATLTGHMDYVKEAVVSPAGDRIATASGDGTLAFWDGRTYERIGEPIDHESAVNAVAFSPDGRKLATAAADGIVRVFDVRGGAEPQQLQHPIDVRDVQFSADGSRLLTVTHQAVRLWSVATGRVQASLATADRAKPIRAKLSPDGRWIAVGETTGVRLWDARSQREVRHWPHEDYSNVAFTPDGRELVTGSSDNRVRIFDLTTGAQRLEVTPGTGPIRDVAFDASGQLVTVGEDSMVRRWEPSTGLPVKAPLRGHDDTGARSTLPAVDLAMRLAVSGTVAITSKARTLRAWDLATGRERWASELLTDTTSAVRTTADGALAIVGSDDERARIVDVATGTLRAELPARAAITDVDFSRSRAALVVSGAGARIWLPDRAPIWTAHRLHDSQQAGISYLVPAADGARVATIGMDQRLAMHDRRTGRRLWVTERPPEKTDETLYVERDMNDVAFVGPDRLVAAISMNLAFVDASDGRILGLAAGHEESVRRVVASKDGKTVVSTDGKALLFWRVEADRLQLSREDPPVAANPGALALSHDGSRLAIGYGLGDIAIVEVTTGKHLGSLHGHRDSVRWVELCADGRLLSAGADKTARIWNVDTKTPPTILRGHTEILTEAHFFDDCQKVITSSYDGTIAVWNATTGERLLVHHGGRGAVSSVAVVGDLLVGADSSNVLFTGPLAIDAYLEAACAALDGDPRLTELGSLCRDPLASLARRPAWW